MSTMDKTEDVQKQYLDDRNLSVRTSFNMKYGTNPKGFAPWLFEQYMFSPNCRILELGCGNGWQWDGRVESLPNGCTLILSDFSEGMVNIVAEKYQKYNHVSCKQIDIQDIPFEDGKFDVVIANHMLYHIPDLSKALFEVSRVLKPGGKFYSSTNGNGGIRTFLRNAMKQLDANSVAFAQDFSFHLQNGKEILEKYFTDVRQLIFEDSLEVTQTQDLIDWMKSTISISAYSENEIDDLYDYLEAIRRSEGAIHIEKEAGLFISAK